MLHQSQSQRLAQQKGFVQDHPRAHFLVQCSHRHLLQNSNCGLQSGMFQRPMFNSFFYIEYICPDIVS